jgi:hypothetical protein
MVIKLNLPFDIGQFDLFIKMYLLFTRRYCKWLCLLEESHYDAWFPGFNYQRSESVRRGEKKCNVHNFVQVDYQVYQEMNSAIHIYDKIVFMRLFSHLNFYKISKQLKLSYQPKSGLKLKRFWVIVLSFLNLFSIFSRSV